LALRVAEDVVEAEAEAVVVAAAVAAEDAPHGTIHIKWPVVTMAYSW